MYIVYIYIHISEKNFRRHMSDQNWRESLGDDEPSLEALTVCWTSGVLGFRVEGLGF